MSFAISETVKWKEEIRYGKFDLIDRNFVINESRGHCGLKVSVNFRRTEKNNPEMEMKVIEGAETLNDPVSITLRFDSSDGSGAYTFDSSFGLNVQSLKSGYSCPRFENMDIRKCECEECGHDSVLTLKSCRFSIPKLT